jgi:hypothetical protein
MARFFESREIAYERHEANRVVFGKCIDKFQAEDGRSFSLPDFFLPAYSAMLLALVIVCNDEFSHRRYVCEFQRIYNTVNALCARENEAATRILFVRVNPHFHHVGTKMFDVPLIQTHEKLLFLLNRLRPEDLLPGVSLAYIGYDTKEDGSLCIFDTDSSVGGLDASYMDLYKNRVIHIG